MLAWWARAVIKKQWITPDVIHATRRLPSWLGGDWLYTGFSRAKIRLRLMKSRTVLRLRVDCPVDDALTCFRGPEEGRERLRQTLTKDLAKVVLDPSFLGSSLVESRRVESRWRGGTSELHVELRMRRDPRDALEAVNILRCGKAIDFEAEGGAGPILQALRAYCAEVGGYPGEDAGLNALLKNPGVSNWRGPYAHERDLRDRWGKPFHCGTRDGVHRVVSVGPDWELGTADDIVHNLPGREAE